MDDVKVGHFADRSSVFSHKELLNSFRGKKKFHCLCFSLSVHCAELLTAALLFYNGLIIQDDMS